MPLSYLPFAGHFLFWEGAWSWPDLAGIRASLAVWKLRLSEHANNLPGDLLAFLVTGGAGQKGQEGVESILRLREAELSRIQTERGASFVHRGARQIVCRDAEQEFLPHHVGGFGFQHVQPDLAFERAQIGFDVPAVAIQVQDLVRWRSQGGKEIQFLPFVERIANLERQQPSRDRDLCRDLRVGAQVIATGDPEDLSISAGGRNRAPFNFLARISVSRNRQGWFC